MNTKAETKEAIKNQGTHKSDDRFKGLSGTSFQDAKNVIRMSMAFRCSGFDTSIQIRFSIAMARTMSFAELAMRDRFYNAPCVIFIIGSKSVKSLDVDCALAASYIMFSAIERGLGTCWINLGSNIRDPQSRALLAIPEGCRIVAPIIIGYPKEIPPASERHAPEILRVIS